MATKNDIEKYRIELSLNSFVRRTNNTNCLKEIIKSYNGILSRQGRSRNWRLILPYENRQNLIDELYQANEASWLWLAKKLAEHRLQYEQSDLLLLISRTPSITINELMELTNCTAKEARLALDEFEWQK